MRYAKFQPTTWRSPAAAILCTAATFLTGCQVEYAGQTLPSPYYLSDDIQYYAPGPEFKLAREAAAMQEQREAIESEQQEALGNQGRNVRPAVPMSDATLA
jgi:hypothetical protein